MITLQPIRRITVYAAQELKTNLLSQFHAMGSKGYTLVEASGVGSHPTAEDPFATSSHVRIELLVRPAVADRIMEYLHSLHSNRQPVTACVEEVKVADPEHF
jgi:hypothetical protein